MDFLKPIFADKAMTFEEFRTALSAAKEIKLANLGTGEYVAKGKLDAAEAKSTGLQKQLDDANTAIKGFEGVDVDGIKKQVGEWEAKYNTDTAALQQKLDDTVYAQTVRDATSALKFSSESARRAFVSDLTAKKLQTQDGKLLGFDDFKTQYAAADPAAFISESDNKIPVFTKNTNQPSGNSPDSSLRAAMGLAPEK